MSSMASECQYAQQLVQTYFRILTTGCGRSGEGSSSANEASASEERCSNAYCRSSNSSNSSLSPTDAAILSVHLATQAPIPLCMPLVGYYLPLSQQEDDKVKEDCPETDDGDDQEEQAVATDSMTQLSDSTPRRRLSSAMELDLTFSNLNTTTNSKNGKGGKWSGGQREEQEDEEAEHRDLMTRPSLNDRKLSLFKKKLLEALKKSIPGIARDRTLGIDMDIRKAGQ